MKRAYLAISFVNRSRFEALVKALKSQLLIHQIELFVFVDEYHFKPEQEQEMMQTAFAEIELSDLLIAELTTKSIGVGIELGYAYAKNKPVLYIRHESAKHSSTASGSAKNTIFYKDTKDLQSKLDVVAIDKLLV
jgi:nucleoside 2-deoxyribosyltransferase